MFHNFKNSPSYVIEKVLFWWLTDFKLAYIGFCIQTLTYLLLSNISIISFVFQIYLKAPEMLWHQHSSGLWDQKRKPTRYFFFFSFST